MVSIDEELAKIIAELEFPFTEKGFILKRKRFFERINKKKQIEQYEIRLSKEKGYLHLHLILRVIDKLLLKKYNQVLEKTLTDDKYIYPLNWSENIIKDSIKTRLSRKSLHELTDWKSLKNDGESLEDFNERFYIWVSAFDKINEIENWKNQLLLSIELAEKYFEKINNINFIIDSLNDFDINLILYLLKDDSKKLEVRYQQALSSKKNSKQSTLELELFYKHLTN